MWCSHSLSRNSDLFTGVSTRNISVPITLWSTTTDVSRFSWENVCCHYTFRSTCYPPFDARREILRHDRRTHREISSLLSSINGQVSNTGCKSIYRVNTATVVGGVIIVPFPESFSMLRLWNLDRLPVNQLAPTPRIFRELLFGRKEICNLATTGVD